MRRCPACGVRLPFLTVVDPTRLLTFLCGRCWATVRLNPGDFARYTFRGALLGLAIIVALFVLGLARVYDLGNLFWFPLAGGWIGGRFFPRLEVQDPPISKDAANRPLQQPNATRVRSEAG